MFLSQSRKTSRGGFTLIELLVVIAIIGVLVGLLLPAVQQAREAARRSACTNKLKQIGLAALNYESSNKRLPSALRTQETYAIHGQANSSGRWSFIVTLLPFMEQLPLHQTLMDKITTDSGARPWKGNNGQRHNGKDTNDVELFELLCPSDANGSRTSAGMTTRGRTSYRINRGDMRRESWTSGCSEKPPRGPGAAGWTGWNNSYAEQSIQFKDITDGTSNTIMFGEARIGDMSGDSRTGGYGIAAGMANGKAGYGTCEALIGADGKYTAPDNGGTGNMSNAPGCRWADSEEGFTQFFTHAPPNAARCSVNQENWQSNPASSYHPGGANMTHVDGSVKFYNDNIDAGDPSHSQTGWSNANGYSGASQRGLIGALGSMNGGEVASSP